MSRAPRGLWSRQRREAARADSWGDVTRASASGARGCLAASSVQLAVSAAVEVVVPPVPLPAVPDKCTIWVWISNMATIIVWKNCLRALFQELLKNYLNLIELPTMLSVFYKYCKNTIIF